MWKEGFSKLTPMDHALAKRTGHLWAFFGGITACAALLIQVPYGKSLLPTATLLGFGVLVGGISYLQFIEWRKENQKIEGLNALKKMGVEK